MVVVCSVLLFYLDSLHPQATVWPIAFSADGD